MDRRTFLAAVGGVSATAVLVGCGDSSSEVGAAPSPAVGAGPAAGTFPATVTHRYGSTTVPAQPQRIVTLGQTDHDAVVALGMTPIAVAGFTGGTYSPFRPWNATQLASKPPVLDMLEVPFEKVAALAPDLILSVMSGLTKADYAKLTAIAPTVAQPVDYEDWAVPCTPHTTLIGGALGQPAAAEQLLADLDAAFSAAQQQHPSLVGLSTICAELYGSDFDVLGPAAPRSQFLTDLGMVLSPSLTDLVGKGYNAPLSAEKLDLLDDLDVVVWTTDLADTPKLLGHTIVQTLRTTTEGRYLLAPNGGVDDLLYSMDWGSVLSNRWAIENAVPRLVKAADGDPATDPNQP